jgi:hypothetical protein
MAVQKFTDAGIFFAGWNLTGQSNSVTLNRSAEMLDVSVFGVGTRVNAPGLLDLSADVAGFWDTSTDAVTSALFSKLGTIATSMPLILYPSDTDLGEAYALMATQESLETLGAIGEAQPFSTSFRNAREGTTQTHHFPIVSGGYLAAQHTSRTSAGNGSATQAGALSSAQQIVFASMVTAFDATTVEFILESDDAVGFDGTPQDRSTHTFTGANEADMTSVVGPITDDYWRVKWTVTGTSFSGVAVFGIV